MAGWLKKAAAICGSVIIACFWLEVFSYIAYYLYADKTFSYSKSKEKLAIQAEVEIADASNEGRQLRRERTRFLRNTNAMIHPYLGYGPVPGIENIGRDFLDEKPDANTVKVGLTGGSNAYVLYFDTQAMEHFKRQLATIPAFTNKKIEIIGLSWIGYKQPQQTIALMLYQMFGGHLDMLVNLDGNNEMIEAGNNQIDKIFYGYPFLWRSLVGSYNSLDITRSVAKVAWLRDIRRELAQQLQGSWLSYSVTALLSWELLDDIMNHQVNHQLTLLNEKLMEHSKSFAVTGPYDNKIPQARLERMYARIWSEGSYMLNNLSNAYGVDYFHFLQPIPVWPGHKQLSQEEIAIGIERGKWKKRKIRTYKIILEESQKLQAKGVRFYSLANVFKNTKQTVWTDDISHVNAYGNMVLVDAMAEQIRRYYEQEPASVVTDPPAASAP